MFPSSIPPTGPQGRWVCGRRRGLGTIEVLVVLCLAGLAAAAASNGIGSLIQGQRLQAAASELESEMQLAKSTALLRGEAVRLAIQPLTRGSCLIVHTGARDACHCRAAGDPVCTDGAQVAHLRRHDDDTGVAYQTSNLSLAFSASHGTVTPTATIRLTDALGRSLHQVVNLMGRIRTCSPDLKINGYKPC